MEKDELEDQAQVLEEFSRDKDDRIAKFEAMIKHKEREYAYRFGKKKS